jgi:uncharacterized coiled-coil protein SlyX
MNDSVSTAPRSRAVMVSRIVLWTWLIGLTGVMLVGLRMTDRLVQQDQLDKALRQQQGLETRLTALTENLHALQALPPAATAQALQSARESLEGRLVSVERAVSAQATTLATANDVAALRTEVEQITTRQAAMRSATEAQSQPRKSRPVVTVPTETPIDFRVIGAELRAGLRSVLIAPLATSSTGSLSADQLQPVMPGESVGAWRLEAIEDQTAVFRSGGQTRRVAIP